MLFPSKAFICWQFLQPSFLSHIVTLLFIIWGSCCTPTLFWIQDVSVHVHSGAVFTRSLAGPRLSGNSRQFKWKHFYLNFPTRWPPRRWLTAFFLFSFQMDWGKVKLSFLLLSFIRITLCWHDRDDLTGFKVQYTWRSALLKSSPVPLHQQGAHCVSSVCPHLSGWQLKRGVVSISF